MPQAPTYSSTSIWNVWNTSSITMTPAFVTSASTGESIAVWQEWTNNTSTSTVATMTRALVQYAASWTAWNATYSASAAVSARHDVRASAEWRERTIRVEAERASARDRAEKLLRERLTPKQRDELSAKGHFHLELLKGNERKLYRIERGRSRNVKQVDDSGRVLKTLCAHPYENVPDADTMLAQKLWLETAEDEFLRVANHS